jgi:NAD(P)-dependent dehydrogenase (short-subunit alcohol dehydrogenase family)
MSERADEHSAQTIPGRRHVGRLAIVTGGALGVGRAYARRLAAEGAIVVIADVADASEAVEDIERDGGRAHAVRCDVSSPEDVAQLSRAVADLGGASILVHNAAIFPIGPYEQITFAEWRQVLSVNPGLDVPAGGGVPTLHARAALGPDRRDLQRNGPRRLAGRAALRREQGPDHRLHP